MSLLTDDQKLIQDTARSFLAEEGGIARQLRHWRDTGCSDGFGTGLWKQFGELGLTGISIPESAGGADDRDTGREQRGTQRIHLHDNLPFGSRAE